jgi:hypothetical protein
VDLTAAQTELKARGGDYLSTSRLTTFLNDAKNEFEDFYPWPWLETTTTGTAPLTISDLKASCMWSTRRSVQELTGVNAQFIVEDLGRDDHDDRHAGCVVAGRHDDAEGVPGEHDGRRCRVRYVKFSPELSAGADTPLIPVRNHNLWIDLAYVRVLKDTDDAGAAQALQADVNAKLAKLVETYAARNRQNSTTFVQLRGGAEDW